jgi:hypothetical protein
VRVAAALLCAMLPWTLAAAQADSASIPLSVTFSPDGIDRSVGARFVDGASLYPGRAKRGHRRGESGASRIAE